MKRLNLNIDDRTAAQLAERADTEERSATEIVRRALEMYFAAERPTMIDLGRLPQDATQ